MKHEQAINDSKNKVDTLRFARSANRFVNRDDVLVWLSLAWFVALCGAAIRVLFPLWWTKRAVLSAVQTLYAASSAAQAVGGHQTAIKHQCQLRPGDAMNRSKWDEHL
jgi:hypothetical protein